MANMVLSLFKKPKRPTGTIINNIYRATNSSEDPEESNVEQLLWSWGAPKVRIDQVYQKKGFFERKSGYAIHKMVGLLPIQEEYQKFQLMGWNRIRKHTKKYRYLHVAYIRISINPLHRSGLNCDVLVALRDCRQRRFDDSLLAMAESSLCDGPIYFDCCPNFLLSLDDSNVLDALTLNVRAQYQGFQRNQDSRDVVVLYTLYYKVMKSDLMPGKSKVDFLDKKTTIVQSNLLKDRVAVSRTINWDSVDVPAEWKRIPKEYRTVMETTKDPESGASNVVLRRVEVDPNAR